MRTVSLPETWHRFIISLHYNISTVSSFQLIEYNATIGAVLAQGYSNPSTWSRGQAWGIYGFANNM